MKIKEINTDTDCGRLLLAALAIITTESRTNKTPDEALDDLVALSAEMFNSNPPAGERREH